MDSDASELFSDCGSDDRDSSTSEPCSSDDLSFTPAAAAGIHRLLLSCAAEASDGPISSLVAELESPKASVGSLRRAAMELRLLAKHNPDGRIRIGASGAVRPLVSLLSHADPLVQEHGVTALLNLSICDENKAIMVEAGAIRPLVRALKSAASPAARENAACALLRLSQLDSTAAAAVGHAGAIPLLVSLLETGGARGKKDAATALYTLCSGARENRLRAVEAGAVRPLLDLMSDPESGMVDKAAYLLHSLVGSAEGRSATVKEGGISVLVEMVEVGTSRQKEIAILSLLQICDDNAVYRTMVAREGAIPPLVALSQPNASPKLKTKANQLLFLLRDLNKQKISTHMGVMTDAANEVLSSKMLADKENTKQANSEAEMSSSLAVTSAMDAPMTSSLAAPSAMDAPMSSSLAAPSAMDAPMSSSLGAMGPLLRKLDSMLPPDYRLPKALKGKIELLKADLEEISVALVEQSTADSPNEMAKYWMNEVRELCYDIEDFIDSIMSTHTDAKMRSAQSYKVGRVKIAWLPKRKPCTRAAKITDLRALVREAIERHERYLDGCTSSSRCVFTGHGRIPAMYAEAAHCLVGVDDAKTKLVKWLIDEEEQQLKVVAIVGPAGIGKTALAKQVYHELGEQFECRAFVRASRKPDMRRLLGGILSQVQGHRRPSDSCTVQNLIDDLTKHLQNKRYVVVIDDLWETTAWDIVTSAFPEGTNCSRIITTTESEGVAQECCDDQSNNILKMKPLGREDSGKLLYSLVFGPECIFPEQLNFISEPIITKCAGLPLATIFVAGLLTSEPDNAELWQYVQQCLYSNLSTNSTLEETVQEILKLSFNSLPRHLKTCLMYARVYPEGYTMWKIDLIKQWMAEGFIGVTEGTDTWEVAYSYFGELVNRGMIQPVDINYNGEVLSCTLHHVVLDLITLESTEERFITALDYSQNIRGHYSNFRRLSFHFSNTRYATKPTGLSLSKVRSIGFFGILECVPSIVEFKLLRVLIFEFWGDQRGSTSFNLARICSLFQLRYLKILCDASVEVELPTQMRMLRYLETLIIDAAVSAVPLDIIHLPGLLYLSLGDKTDLPDEIGRISSLRTLHYFDIGSNSEDNVLSLGDLVNLQDLHLTYYTEDSDEHCTAESNERMKRNLAALASSLGKLANLKYVTLAPGVSGMAIYHDVWSSMSSPPIFLQRLELSPPICIFSRLPEWIGQLRKLCILKIVVGEMLMKDMDILTELPALTVLSLHVRQPTAERVIFKRGTFPALKYFNYTCGAICLAFQEGALPNLKRLELSFNAHRGEDYDHFLAGIEYLLNLKEIAGTIGAAPGAEEPDRRAAESAFKDAIRNHPRFPSYDYVKRADWIEEEYDPQEEQHSIRYKDPLNEHGGRKKRIFEYIKQNPDMDLNDYVMFCRSQHSAQVLDAQSSCWVVTDFSTLASDCGIVTSDSSSVDSAESESGGAAGASAYIVECAAFWGLTSISSRSPENWDAAIAVPRFFSLPLFLTGNAMVDGPYPMWFRLRAHFFGVYDGHGGVQVANYCRDRLHAVLVEELGRTERPLSGVSWGTVEFKKQWEKAFVDVFCMVDDEVGGKVIRGGGQGVGTRGLAKAAEVEPLAPETMGSTAVVAVVWFSHIIIANCGDSRAVLCRGKQAMPLTVDHKPNRKDEYARIEAAGGKIIQWDGYRVFGVLSMSRSIGDWYLKPWIIPVPEVTVVPRQKEDEFLILASDGLWNVLSNQEVCDVARKRILLWHKKNIIDSSSAERSGDSSDPAAQEAAEYLSKLALQKGSKDDITVIVVDLKAKRKFKNKLGT
uniref:protein-serine/threonine phosphatase n=2 Tax=Triticum urartu TaxID=4572 RepID=A0A8R7V3K9_TRIUA